MAIPESIPEDREECYLCPYCGGDIKKSKDTDKWECNKCDWTEDMEKQKL